MVGSGSENEQVGKINQAGRSRSRNRDEMEVGTSRDGTDGPYADVT